MRRMFWLGLLIALALPAAAQPPTRFVITPDNAHQLKEVTYIRDERRLNSLPIAWSPDGSALAVGVPDGVQIYDLTERGFVRGVRLDMNDSARAMTYNPDGSLLAVSAGKSGAIYLWNARTGDRAAVMEGKDLVEHLAFSPDNRLLASTIRGITTLWGVTGQPFTPANAYKVDRQAQLMTKGATLNVAFSADGATVLLAQAIDQNQHAITFWDVTTEAQIGSLDAPDVWTGFAVAPDDSLLVYGADSIIVWDNAAQETLAVLAETSTQSVDALSLHPDLTLLAASYNDGRVRVWDLQTYEERVTFSLGWISDEVAFSPDGTLLAARGWDDGVHIWGLGDPIPVVAAPSPTATAAPEATAAAEPTLQVGGSAVIQTTSGDRLNARSGAGRGFDIVTKLAPGTAVTIIGGPQTADGFTWWQIRTADGVEGWVVERADDEQTLFPTN